MTKTNSQLTPVIPLSDASHLKRLTSAIAIVAIVGMSFGYLQVDPLTALADFPSFIRFFMANFWPMKITNLTVYLPLVLQTLLFAVVGTYFSAFLAFFCGILMSEETNPVWPLRIGVRVVISFLRNIPILVWASLLVYIFGIGPLVGLLALILATLGFLARSYAESIDEIGATKLEALRATGASYWQVLFHGLIPEFLPAWLNWTLFSFEINIRASAILGMVGAGGIGIMIQTNIRLFKYHEALFLIVMLAVLVLLTEFSVNLLRKKIR